ncbi:MerR family transcriptional regulator [Streptomyces angustmyceticus]|uniref:MerR family transcriptional regulator n=2 Tax=Streptomyces angustmyceticus TaxID=285578 RepID=A0A5J4LQR4_9ACTN|nr:MerR family transcriptional regulator [Streptomyces angustmyceticus]UAL69473.1 MerR family transcriptional regulator [Streptomyces angustmyceticus]GES32768.1 MerR family transcriptional regulator [Streptomyces angustmyceticus]
MRIGELAGLVGVSTRAVRHYHHLGLLPEPERRANGYRDYGLRDAVALARVRRLTELGLGLDEARDVLADDAGRELHEVLDGLDADLARQEEEIRARRARLAAVRRQAEQHGGLPAEGPVSDELAALFAEMARTSAGRPGPEPAMAAKEREVLALLESTGGAAGRKRMVELLGEMAAAPGAMDRTYEVYGLLDALADAAVDDPRVEPAARALADCIPAALAGEVEAEHWERVAGAGQEADEGFMAAYYAHFAPAQAQALRRAIRMVAERAR